MCIGWRAEGLWSSGRDTSEKEGQEPMGPRAGSQGVWLSPESGIMPWLCEPPQAFLVSSLLVRVWAGRDLSGRSFSLVGSGQ